ncbi:MAG: hypothetical protein PVF27_00825 [Gemmatimonadales bacterium]
MARPSKLFERALAEVTPSMSTIAGKLGVSMSTLRRYRDGTEPMPPVIFHCLATVLRARAAALMRLAEQLDDHVGANK